jgi:hypothetical protein
MYWPLKYRHIAREWRETTSWGALFQEYQAQGHLAEPTGAPLVTA